AAGTNHTPLVRPPTSVTAAAGNARVDVAWRAHADAAPDVLWQTRHAAEAATPDARQWSGWVEAPGGAAARSAAVEGLVHGTTYVFEVRAASSAGVTSRHDASTAVAVTATLGLPTLSIAAGDAATEGGTAEFTITADQAPQAELEVAVSVTQGPDDDYLPDTLPESVALASGATQAVLSIGLPDDDADEPDGVVTATLVARAGSYEVATASASLTVHDDDRPPLTARLHDVPREHGGTDREFSFGLEFSEALAPLPAARLRDEALRATNATVRQAKRVVKGETGRWTITVAPDAVADVTVTLAATTDCGAAGALCTEDGRGLSNSVSATVAGPPNRPATGAPAIAGPARVGETLTASTSDIEDADGLTDATFAYQWLSDDADIGGATAASYTLADTDEGAAVKVRVGFTDDVGHDETLTSAATAPVAAVPPLTAEFVDVPESHDGRGLFEFELRFSEDFPGRLPYTLLRDAAFAVDNGSVREAGRIEQGRNQRWRIAVRPDSHREVTIELPATTDCAAPGAVCTEAGRPLSNTVTATVAGPAPLTAEFVGMPASHDGTNAFEFELRFSEDFPGRLSYTLLRDAAFEVENGAVQRAGRVEQEQNRRWTIAVQPDSHDPVTITLPAATDCGAPGAVCTEAGRPLSNAPSATVAGPRPGARVDGPLLTLAWPTPRDGFAAPGGADFAVRVDGGLRAVASTSLWMRGVALTLDEPVRAGQAVAVDYLGSAMHPLRDAAGVAAPAWRDLPAVNVTGLAADGLALADAVWPPAADGLSLSLAGLGLGDAGLAGADIDADVRRLDLSDNGLADLAALARLRALESLDLSDNAIADVSALRGLTALRRLDLGGNDVAEVWPLADLPELNVLVLDGNRVADVGALTHLARLEQLGLSGNAVSDLSPLADLWSLRRLDLGGNPARDLSPVGDLQRLVWLRLPAADGAAPTHRLVRLRWLLAPDTPGRCLACEVLRAPAASGR
ncbi:MAG: leucine-rich repeat domain-containing protein, partial [Gammaproteobacteria bacterium]|nr:leucine-rich repeat domain-containing protein [Gammaproteobacteria bacterium]